MSRLGPTWNKFLAKARKLILKEFLGCSSNWKFPSICDPSEYLRSSKFSEKSYMPFLSKTGDWPTDILNYPQRQFQSTISTYRWRSKNRTEGFLFDIRKAFSRYIQAIINFALIYSHYCFFFFLFDMYFKIILSGIKYVSNVNNFCSFSISSYKYLWCVARFDISHYLAFAWLFERMRMHANAFFYVHVVFIRLHELVWPLNESIKCQTLECHSNA